MSRYAKHLLVGTAVEVTALGLGCVTVGYRRQVARQLWQFCARLGQLGFNE
jgi:hypothetical protein